MFPYGKHILVTDGNDWNKRSHYIVEDERVTESAERRLTVWAKRMVTEGDEPRTRRNGASKTRYSHIATTYIILKRGLPWFFFKNEYSKEPTYKAPYKGLKYTV